MKKLLALSIVLLTVAGAAFAQFPDGIKFGGWGRADFVPVQGQFRIDKDNAASFGQAKSGLGSGFSTNTRAELRIVADFQTVGTRFWIGSDTGTSWAVGDYADIWVKPFGNDTLKIDAGKFLDETLRGKVATDSNFALFTGIGKSGDPIFQRFNGWGALIQSSPVQGLYIGAMVKPPAGALGNSNGVVGEGTVEAVPTPGQVTRRSSGILYGSPYDAVNIWKGVQAAIGYTIPNVGLFRVQYVGNAGWDGKHLLVKPRTAPGLLVGPGFYSMDPEPQFSRIEAAFQYNGLTGLNLDLGTKIFLPVTDDKADMTYQNNNQINLGVNYTAGNVGLLMGIYTGFGGSTKPDKGKTDKLENGFDFQGILEPSFLISSLDATLGGNLNIHAVGPSIKENKEQKDDWVQVGFGLWIRKAFSKGSVKTGAAFVLPRSIDGKTKSKNGGYITVPVILEFSF